MEQNKFDKLIDKRHKWVQSSKENNFDFDSILAGIYNDPSHFIYEILQNAEDADAKEISFNLFENKLEIVHDGKDFDFNNVDGITGIGISTKKEDLNAIGKFGVGFKSVFAITKTPIIHSGPYHFKIEDFVIPSIIESNGIEETQIILPFNHPTRSSKEVYEIVGQKLESIGLKTLLFLKNIEEIKWQTPEKSGHYYKESKCFEKNDKIQKVSIISKIEDDEDFEEFLVIQKPVKIDSHILKVEIAYRIEKDDSGKDIILKEKDSKLIVFFPTEKVTYLNFLIQGPYKTTPNRENIPLDDEQNQYIIKETANLVAESIPLIKELGLLNVSFLEVIPIEQNHTDEIIYSCIYEKVKGKLSSDEAFLPTSSNNFTTTKNAILARGKGLTETLNSNDIKILFDKEQWLNTNITYDRTRILRDYLINELDVLEVDFEDLAVNISKEFIERKSDEWLLNFYGRLLDQRSLWAKSGYYGRNAGILREKPIIRLPDNTHIAPCDKNNKIQVYLPADTKSKYKTVKKEFTQNENSLKFLTELGLTKPDIFAEIKEFVITKYVNSNPDVDIEEYLDDFEKLVIAFKKDKADKQKELIDDLKKLYIIYSTNSISGSNQFRMPQEVYLKNEDLLEYFKGYDSVFFVSNELYQRFSSHEDGFIDFLLAVGCENKPRRIQIASDLSDDEKKKLRDNNWCTREIHTIDYDYEGLENFLSNLTKEKSCILWNFLLKSLASYSRWGKHNFFKGEYSWFYRSQKYKKFDSKFLKTLKNTKWLFNKNDSLVFPNEVTISELANRYSNDDENVEYLKRELGFKSDIIDLLPEDEKKILEIAKDRTPEDIEKALALLDEKKKQKQTIESDEDDLWNSEIDPENLDPRVEKIEPELVDTPDRGGQRLQEKDDGYHPDDYEAEEPEETRKKMSKKKLKDIGNWGERYVFKYLKQKYSDETEIDIIWLNANGDLGKGYDFSIVSNGEEIEYIEVKSKIDEEPKLFEITGTQWEFARKLYNKNEGDKYKIYVVSSTGSENAKIRIIKNPTKLWKEGKLYAHPVHFKL